MSDWWKTAQPGDRIVCVDAHGCDCGPLNERPVEGRIYSIAEIDIVLSQPQVRLAGTDKYGWHVWRFKPVEKRSTEEMVRRLKEIAKNATEPAFA